MTIAVTDLGTNSNTSGATIALTIGVGGVPAGSLICIAIAERGGSISAGSVADTAGNTYTRILPLKHATSTVAQAIYYAWNSTALSNTNTITFTKAVSGDITCISGFYATGVQTSSDPHDSAVDATVSAATATPTLTSGTPGIAGELFVALVDNGSGSGDTFTQDSGNGWAVPFTGVVSTTNAGLNGGNQVNSGTGTKVFAPTFVTGPNLTMGITGFKPVPGTQPVYNPWLQRGPILAS